MMNTNNLHKIIINAIGKNHESEEVKTLLNYLNISWPEFSPEDSSGEKYEFDSKEKSINLTFVDIGSINNIPFHDIGDGPFILEDISFWGHVENYSRNTPLPFDGITFESTLADFEKILGTGKQKTVKPGNPYQWYFKDYKITATWPDKPNKIRNITYWYTPESQG